MKLTDETMRDLFLEAVSGSRGKSCIPSDELARAAEGGLPAPRRDAVAEHLVTCSDCAHEYQVLRCLWQGATDLACSAPQVEAVPSRAPPPLWARGRWFAWAAAAAGVAMAVVLPLALREPPPTSPPAMRSAGSSSLYSLVPEDRELPRDRVVLRWRGIPGARYAVELAMPDFTPLATAKGLERAEYRVPPRVLSRLPAGGRFLWSVTAILPDGSRITSPAFANRIR